MFAFLRQRGLVLPTALTIAGLAVLVSLGVWQWQRMHWKAGIIARLEAAAARPPRDYGSIDLAALGTGEASRYTRVTATGRFEHAQEVYVFNPRYGKVGYLVLTPFVPSRGKPILVNRGFVPASLRLPSTRPKGQAGGEVTIRGLLVRARPPASTFIPDADVAKRIWYHVAPAGMAKALGLDVVPNYTIEAGPQPNPGGWPRGRDGRERITAIPNRHFEYALTWWGLALTLLAVYLAYALARPAPQRPDGV